jgi:hypothetical protein
MQLGASWRVTILFLSSAAKPSLPKTEIASSLTTPRNDTSHPFLRQSLRLLGSTGSGEARECHAASSFAQVIAIKPIREVAE